MRVFLSILVALIAIAGIAGVAMWVQARGVATPPPPVSVTVAPPTAPGPKPAPPAAETAPAPAPSPAGDDARDLPQLDAAAQELHGRWRGESFWARLRAADKAFGGKRVLELVYQPPPPAELGGAVLVDCPFVLLDRHARIAAWNGRDGLSRIDPWTSAGGYHVVRELHDGVGEEAAPHGVDQKIVAPPAWDLRLAPLLVALAWKADGDARVPTIDFFAAAPGAPGELRWQGAEVTCAGSTWRVEAGPDGRLQRLLGADGSPILSVEGRP